MNYKRSSQSMATMAAKALSKESTSNIQRSLAASVLSQREPSKQTGARMEDVASRVLQSPKYSEQTKRFAASVLSQSNKER